jgi:hypothetical protein
VRLIELKTGKLLPSILSAASPAATTSVHRDRYALERTTSVIISATPYVKMDALQPLLDQARDIWEGEIVGRLVIIIMHDAHSRTGRTSKASD